MASTGGTPKKEAAKEAKAEAPGRGGTYRAVAPDSFTPEVHFYPRVLSATIHPIVSGFLNMSNARIVKRYCHLHPAVDPEALSEILSYQPRQFRWAGCDLFHVATLDGMRQMVVVETNSCPSGQKSMPLLTETDEMGGYRFLLENAFSPLLHATEVEGDLAVVYDKNEMEASGYAAALAELTGERVHMATFYISDPDPPVRFVDRVMEVRTEAGEWRPIRAAFRYVTQRPWTRIPLQTKTLILNPVLPCLAGGRNKLVASKAYDVYNADLLARSAGLAIRTPETRQDVGKEEVPLLVRTFGGQAVVKVPYLNAGQGVYTITSDAELAAFMAQDFVYDKFIVQSLIGNRHWSSTSQAGTLFHVGTLPNKRNEIFVCDVRMQVGATSRGYRPVAVYARRAHKPLTVKLASGADSWAMLGTNLSVNVGADAWDTETNRLLLMSTKDFNKLGIGIDELIDGYVQTVLAAVAIDKMCGRLVRPDGSFNIELFSSLNNDENLVSEIMQ